MIFRIKNTFILLLLSLFSISSLLPMRTPTAPGPLNGQMKLSQEDLELLSEIEKMSKESPEELEELWNVIMSEVDKMPEDQREQFWQDVEQTAQVLEKEFAQIIEEEEAKKAAEEPVEEAPEKPTVEPTPIISKTKEKDLESAADIIGNLIDKIESYLRKSQFIPKFDDKVAQWGKEHKISDWQPGATWNMLQADINFMKTKLYRILERDPKTNQYKHLHTILDDESLYNNLAQLNRRLDQFEPKISAPEPGQPDLSRESKNAIEKVTSALTEALYVLNLPAALDQVIQKYEKRAQELTKEQQEAEKKALRELKKPTYKRPAQAIGREEPIEFQPYEPPFFDDFDAYTPPPLPRKDEPKPAPTPTPKPKEPVKKKPEPKKPEEKKKPEVPEDKLTADAIDSFGKALLKAELTDPKLLNIDTQISKADPKKMSETLSNASGKIRRAGSYLRSVKSRKLKPEQKKKYYANVKSSLETFGPELRQINGRAQKALVSAGDLKDEVQSLIDSINAFFNATSGFGWKG